MAIYFMTIDQSIPDYYFSPFSVIASHSANLNQ